jgi:hypothetical protein
MARSGNSALDAFQATTILALGGVSMRLSFRRVGIAIGALVEAALIMWLLGGFMPAGPLAALVTVVLGALIYQDLLGRA